MSLAFLDQANLKGSLTLINLDKTETKLGLFNVGDIELGSESDENTDPELGVYPTGGRQTGDEVDLMRPWNRTRDRNAYKLLKPLRGRRQIRLAVFEYDDDGLPVSSEPLDTYNGLFVGLTVPGSDANGDDPIEFSLKVRVTA